MDSGNSSGSLQSSSGGGDEDSSSFSAFLNNNPPPPTHVGVVAPFNTSTSHTHIIDPLSNYLDPNPTQRSHPSLLNLDMMWSKPVRSEPNPTHLARFLPCSSSSQHNQQVFLSTHQLQAGETRGSGTTCSAFLDTNQYTLPPESGSRGLLSVSAATNNDDQGNNNVVRNPKKRSRASRRAPTTVLTTDTTNFRAMVQEFTGIPAPPFTSSPFPRTRFDLFPPPLHAATTPSTSTLLDPPYLLRPFAQKLQQQHHLHPFPPPSSSMVDNLLASNNNSNNSTSINYHVSSPLHFNSMHNNPILSFQNILQQTPNYPLANSSSSSVLASTTQQQQLSLEIPPPSATDSHLKMGVLEELGLRHAHVNNTNVSSTLHHHQNMVSSGNSNLSANVSSMEWAQRTSVVTNNNDCDHHVGVIRPLTLSGTITNGKVHYTSASSSDFHGEKGSEECTTVAAPRSQGMVESWINCSSD